MPKKKTTKKKKETKVEYQKHEKIDLDVQSQKQAEELIAHINNMSATQGWQIMKQIMEGNMAVLEQSIITKIDPVTNEKISDEEVDVCRMKWSYLKELTEQPKRLVETFKQQVGMEVPEYDPYATDKRQLTGDPSHFGAPMVSTLKT